MQGGGWGHNQLVGRRGRGQAPGAGGSVSVATGDCETWPGREEMLDPGMKSLCPAEPFVSAEGSESAQGSSPQGTCPGHTQIKKLSCRSGANLMETQDPTLGGRYCRRDRREAQ